jgi:hypothetical protein
MSVTQMLEQFEELSAEELVLLEHGARKARLKKLGETHFEEWAQLTDDMNRVRLSSDLNLDEYPKYVEIWSPFDEIVAARDIQHLIQQKTVKEPMIYMDLRENLPAPVMLTPEEEKCLRP